MEILFVKLRTCHAFFALGDCGLYQRDDCFFFWLITVNPTLVTRYDPRDKSWVLISLLSYLKTRLRTAAFDHLPSQGTNFATMRCMFKFSVKISWQTPIIDPNGVCELMGCSATVFMDEFSNFFNIFCYIAGAWSP
jgi:hypothetical protein